MSEEQRTAGELGIEHIGRWFTLDAPHYPFPISGELKRVEHFTPAKEQITYTAWVYEFPEDPTNGLLLSTTQTIRAERATSLILGHIGLTVPSSAIISDYVEVTDEES